MATTMKEETLYGMEPRPTPGQLLQEVWGMLKGGSGTGVSTAVKIARQHPLPSAVIGLGIGWLLLDSSRATISAADLATNAKEKVSDLASQAGDQLGELTERVKEQASDWTDKVKEQAAELGTQVQRGTRKARLGFWQLLEERPLAVGAATLALGLLAGLAIPSTDVEDGWMGETRDQLFDSAKETGHELLDRGKHLADAALDAVQQT